MAKNELRPQTIKTNKTVTLATYLQSMALTAFVVGTIAFIGGYFTMHSMQSVARDAVVTELEAISTAAKKANQ